LIKGNIPHTAILGYNLKINKHSRVCRGLSKSLKKKVIDYEKEN